MSENNKKELKSLKLGLIYEFLGQKQDAHRIYTAILKDAPDNRAVRDELYRMELKPQNVNEERKAELINAKSQEDIDKFQRWLKQWN